MASIEASSSRQDIKESATKCNHLFAQLVARPEAEINTLGIGFRLHHEHDRFKLWAGSMAVFAEIHVGLDYRMKDAPNAREAVVEQLEILITRLKQRKSPYERSLSTIIRS